MKRRKERKDERKMRTLKFTISKGELQELKKGLACATGACCVVQTEHSHHSKTWPASMKSFSRATPILFSVQVSSVFTYASVPLDVVV